MRRLVPIFLLFALLLTACGVQPTPTPIVSATPEAVAPPHSEGAATPGGSLSAVKAIVPEAQDADSIPLPLLSSTSRRQSAGAPSTWVALVNEDFKNPDPGVWGAEDTPEGIVDYSDAQLSIIAQPGWQISVTPTSTLDLRDGYISATFTVDGDGSAGVQARANSNDTTSTKYACLISTPNAFACYELKTDYWSTLFAGTTAAIKTTGPNTIALQMVGANIQFIINGLTVGSIINGDLASGSWGVFAQANEVATTAHFSHVFIAAPGNVPANATPIPAEPTAPIGSSGRVVGLDPTFSTDGKLTIEFGSDMDEAQAVVALPDGKIVVAGESWPESSPRFALARLHADGTLDGDFGDGGKVVTNVSGQYDYSGIRGLVLQPDGKLLAAGFTRDPETHYSAFGVVRYHPDGTIDGDFGDGGRAIIQISATQGYGTSDAAEALALQPDGKIVVVGITGGFPSDFAMTRLMPDGSLDTSFGNGGRVITDFGYDDKANAVAIQPDGKIIVVGYGGPSGSDSIEDYNFALARYNKNGKLDATFGTGGKILTDLGGYQDEAHSIVILPDGRFVVGGLAVNGAQFCYNGSACWRYGMGLAQYTKTGKLNTTFGTGGKVVVPDVRAAGYGLLRLPDATLALGGFLGDTNFGLGLFNAAGVLVPTFGVKGILSSSFSPYKSSINALALGPDGSIIAAGGATVDPDNILNGDFALIRYK